jgi:hypothetical protein
MGLNDRDIVALSGGHTLVDCCISEVLICWQAQSFKLFACFFRERLILRGLDSKVPGHRSLLSLITRTFCKLSTKSEFLLVLETAFLLAIVN